MTKAMARVPRQFYRLYDGRCHEVPPSAYHVLNATRLSIKMQCDQEGFHEQIFKGANCSEPAVLFDARWSQCVNFGPVSATETLYVIPKSGQFEDECHGR